MVTMNNPVAIHSCNWYEKVHPLQGMKDVGNHISTPGDRSSLLGSYMIFKWCILALSSTDAGIYWLKDNLSDLRL